MKTAILKQVYFKQVYEPVNVFSIMEGLFKEQRYIPLILVLLMVLGLGLYFFTVTLTKIHTIDSHSNYDTDFNDAGDAGDEEFMDELGKLNGDIFWAPASKDLDSPVTLSGDQIRSVFGEFPDETFNCADEDAVSIHIEVNGNQVKLEHDPITGKERFLHCPPNVFSLSQCKWTDVIDQCDKPSLAGNVNFCGTASRIVKRSIGPVDWMLLCRKSKDSIKEGPEGIESAPVYAENYWSRDNPYFRLYGMIGYNNVSGEVAFIDGLVRNVSDHYNWNDPFIAPGGTGYNDIDGRAKAEKFYDPKNSVDCHTCHDNKQPWIITPHLNQPGVGYLDAHRRKAFSNSIIPVVESVPSQPYRIIGSNYVEKRCNEESLGKGCRGLAFRSSKTQYCTQCHSLTTLNTGRLFSFAALNKTNPKMMLGHLQEKFWKELKKSTTGFGLNNGTTWMPPRAGHDQFFIEEKAKPSIDCALQYPLTFSEEAECEYSRIFTDCPIPGGEIDTFRPTNLRAGYLPGEARSAANSDGSGRRGVAVLEWDYKNGYGQIPGRDDVRFEVRMESVSSRGNVSSELRKRIIRDISYPGHTLFSEPEPTEEERNYMLNLPINCQADDEHRFYLTPVRYCFDTSGVAKGKSMEFSVENKECN